MFDLNNYPIIHIKLDNTIFDNDESIDKFERGLKTILNDNTENKINLIFNLLNCTTSPSLKNVFRHGQFLIKNADYYEKSIDKTAIILPNSSWEKFINSIIKLKPPCRPSFVTINYNEGLEFVNRPS